MTSVTECGSNSSGLLSNASKLYFLRICTNPTLATILPKRKAAMKRNESTFNGYFESNVHVRCDREEERKAN